jgi:hypothetical protein
MTLVIVLRTGFAFATSMALTGPQVGLYNERLAMLAAGIQTLPGRFLGRGCWRLPGVEPAGMRVGGLKGDG